MPDRPLVVICALRGRLFHEVERAVAEQWPDYAVHLDEPHPLRTYADFFRSVWAGLGDLVVVEGDSIPPPGAIRQLLDCPRDWCTHESWVGDRYLDNTLGLVKFSQLLQLQEPGLADKALSAPWLPGQHWDRGLGMTAPQKHLGEVPLEESVLRVWPELGPRAHERAMEPGTTIHPKAIDMALDKEFRRLKLPPHVHQPPAPHLRYPATDPAFRDGGR